MTTVDYNPFAPDFYEHAFDVYMKARYLGEQHPGHGMTFATGTPISNTMYSVCLFFALIALSAWNSRRDTRRQRYQ